MNKRCLVNVATGEMYCSMQERLHDSLWNSVDHIVVASKGVTITKHIEEKSTGIDCLLWRDILPEGSRPHSESPYGFKIHAIKAAYERGYTSILWVDSPIVAVAEDMSPIFDKIEKEGYYVMSHIDPLSRYMSPEAYEYWGVTQQQLDDDNMNLPSGSCYGFDLSHACGSRPFASFRAHEANGDFYSDSNNYRHDETVLALVMRHFNLPVLTFDPLFQSDSPECVLKSGGWL